MQGYYTGVTQSHTPALLLAALGFSLRGISTLRLFEEVREGGAEGAEGGRGGGGGRGEGEWAGSGVPREGFKLCPRAAFFGDGSVSLSPGFFTCREKDSHTYMYMHV